MLKLLYVRVLVVTRPVLEGTTIYTCYVCAASRAEVVLLYVSAIDGLL